MIVGGSTLWYRASAALMSPAAPAAAFVWPICDFTEPIAHHGRRLRAAAVAVYTSVSAVDLGRVADLRAGAVGLDQLDRVRASRRRARRRSAGTCFCPSALGA